MEREKGSVVVLPQLRKMAIFRGVAPSTTKSMTPVYLDVFRLFKRLNVPLDRDAELKK